MKLLLLWLFLLLITFVASFFIFFYKLYYLYMLLICLRYYFNCMLPPPPLDTMTHTHTHTRCFLWFIGTLHRRNGFYTVQTVCAIALHINLALTGDGAFLLYPKKTHTVWLISVLNYGYTENVLINHLLVIPMSYSCHYTNLCPHKPLKQSHTHTWSQTYECKYRS